MFPKPTIEILIGKVCIVVPANVSSIFHGIKMNMFAIQIGILTYLCTHQLTQVSTKHRTLSKIPSDNQQIAFRNFDKTFLRWHRDS